MPARELDRWGRYWAEEPWGPYRDNLHTALLAVEVLRPHVKEGAKLNIQDFMFEHKADRDERARSRLVAQLAAFSRKASKRP